MAKEIREKNDKIQHVFLDKECALVIRTDTMLDKAPTPMSSNVLETMDKDYKFETYLRAVGRSIHVKETDVWVQQVKKKINKININDEIAVLKHHGSINNWLKKGEMLTLKNTTIKTMVCLSVDHD